jgi:glucose/arabinose dehydrogenase
MSFSGIVARIVALIGGAALLWRRMHGAAPEPAWGSAPVVPAAKPQGAIPTLRMPTAKGWADGQKPVAAPGLKVNAFATGLEHPRWICVLPNGDVLIAEAMEVSGPVRSVFDYAKQATMRRAAALGVSANRITLLRDRDGDGVAETREVFMEGLNQPFGMALSGDTFYVGNTDGVVAFPYVPGASRITAPGRKLASFKPGGHWTRSLLPSPDGRSSMSVLARSAMSPRMAWPSRKAGLPSTSSIWPAARAASSPAACAIRWVLHGSRRPARCGQWSTSGTAWVTRHRRTI